MWGGRVFPDRQPLPPGALGGKLSGADQRRRAEFGCIPFPVTVDDDG